MGFLLFIAQIQSLYVCLYNLGRLVPHCVTHLLFERCDDAFEVSLNPSAPRGECGEIFSKQKCQKTIVGMIA